MLLYGIYMNDFFYDDFYSVYLILCAHCCYLVVV